MLSMKEFCKIFLYTLVILVSIKLSIYDHSFVHKLEEYNSRKALKQGMKNPYILQKLKNMTQVIPQNLYTICSNFIAYMHNMVRPAH